MSIFLAALVGSMIGQAITFWVIGYFAQLQEAKKVEAIQNAFQEAMMEVEEREKKMREYARMES